MSLKEKRISRSWFGIISSFLFILAGLMIIGYNHYQDYLQRQEDKSLIEEFFEDSDNATIETTEVEVSEENEEVKQESISYDYVAVLEIDSIDLKRGLVDPSSKYNKVNYNIEIINSSTMPDVDNGNLILASHNGNSNISFFRNLNKMNENDLINIYYNGIKYTYKYSYMYEVEKTGKVNIVRDKNQSTLTLITCKKNSKTKQLVFVSYLVDKVEY